MDLDFEDIFYNLKHKEKIETILQILNIATNPMQLNMPGFRFHKLKGKLENVYSVTISV